MRDRLPLGVPWKTTGAAFAAFALSAALSTPLRAGEAPNAEPSPVRFVKHRIGTFRSEALGVGDFNGDGKLDVVAGPYLYLAPDFKALKIRTLKGQVDEQGKGYRHDFMNGPLDVDGDGKLDVVGIDWFSRSSTWFRNSLGKEGDWPETLIEKAGNFECGDIRLLRRRHRVGTQHPGAGFRRGRRLGYRRNRQMGRSGVVREQDEMRRLRAVR